MICVVFEVLVVVVFEVLVAVFDVLVVVVITAVAIVTAVVVVFPVVEKAGVSVRRARVEHVSVSSASVSLLLAVLATLAHPATALVLAPVIRAAAGLTN